MYDLTSYFRAVDAELDNRGLGRLLEELMQSRTKDPVLQRAISSHHDMSIRIVIGELTVDPTIYNIEAAKSSAALFPIDGGTRSALDEKLRSRQYWTKEEYYQGIITEHRTGTEPIDEPAQDEPSSQRNSKVGVVVWKYNPQTGRELSFGELWDINRSTTSVKKPRVISDNGRIRNDH